MLSSGYCDPSSCVSCLQLWESTVLAASRGRDESGYLRIAQGPLPRLKWRTWQAGNGDSGANGPGHFRKEAEKQRWGVTPKAILGDPQHWPWRGHKWWQRLHLSNVVVYQNTQPEAARKHCGLARVRSQPLSFTCNLWVLTLFPSGTDFPHPRLKSQLKMRVDVMSSARKESSEFSLSRQDEGEL